MPNARLLSCRSQDLDLFLVSSEGNELWINADSAGTFTTGQSGISNDGWAAAFLDSDNDGDLDLIVTGRYNNYLWKNNGHGVFTRQDSTAQRFGWGSKPTMAVAIGDVDNDGFVDVFFGTTENNLLSSDFGKGATNQMWKNNHGNGFTQVTSGAPTSTGTRTYSAAFGDLDGDGVRD